MANKLETEIIINLAGNLTAKARQYGANMSEFARNNKRAMSVIQASSAAAGRGLDMLGSRYTAMIAGFGGGAMLKSFAVTDRLVTRMGLAAEKTREEMSAMFDGMQDAAIKFRVDDSEVISAIGKVATVTGDVDFGFKNRNIIAPSIAASGAEGESIGALFSQFTKFNVTDEKGTLQAMDTLNQLGKEGAFELKDIAERGVKAFSMYAAAGGTGVQGIKDVGAALESAADATGDTTTASTAVENLIRDLQLPKVVKTLRQNGIDVFGKDGKIQSLPGLMEKIAKQSGNKGAEKQNARLLAAGFNQDSILLLGNVTSGKGQENLRRYNGVVADGQGIMKDAAYAAKDFTSATQALETTWKKFANSNLAHPVQELADALNSVAPETAQNWLETGKNVAMVVGGVIAARKVFKLGKGAFDFLNPGKGGKGIPAGVADVFGSGVMPVYVTNMPGGGLSGSGSELPGRSGKQSNKPQGLITTAIATAQEIRELMPVPETEADKQKFLQRVQQNNSRSTMWNDLTSWFASTSNEIANLPPTTPFSGLEMQRGAPTYPAVPPQLQGNIEILVKDDRVQVNRVKVNTPGITMSAATGVGNVGQD